jgi:hypothetical protein
LRRKLILLNLALLAAVAGLGWRLRQDWQQAEQRRLQVAAQRVQTAPVPALPPAPPIAPVSAPQYAEVAQKMLFARDRNPNVILDVAPPKPMPALPLSYGFVDFGGDPTVILSETPTGTGKAFRPGDQIGEFKIVSVDRDHIVFLWDGKQVKRTLAEISARNSREALAAQQQQAAAAAPPPSPGAAPGSSAASATAIGGNVEPGPGKKMGEGVFFCKPGDNSPDGTIVNGYKKLDVRTPFGRSCRWDAVN